MIMKIFLSRPDITEADQAAVQERTDPGHRPRDQEHVLPNQRRVRLCLAAHRRYGKPGDLGAF